MWCFFFFKQKSAYELRISDWSQTCALPISVENMIKVADLTRRGFVNGDISTVMSPRTVISWAQNALIFNSVGFAFRLSFLNKCDEAERTLVAEYYQRVFGEDLRSEEHTSELQSLMRISSAVFCLKKQIQYTYI